MKKLLLIALVLTASLSFAKADKVTKEQKEAARKACEASKNDKKAFASCVKEEIKKAKTEIQAETSEKK